MKLRNELGSAAVRDLVAWAVERARHVPDKTVHEPWPNWRRP